MFKCINGQAPSYLCDKFKQRDQVHDRNTSSNEDLDIPKFRTCTGQITFKYRGTKLWNELDKETKLITNLNSFKVKRKTDLMKKHR
jgi:hypothetical protein